MTEDDATVMRDRDIIFVSNMLAVGGAERVLCLLADELSSQGHRVGIISFLQRDDEYAIDDAVARQYWSGGGKSPISRLRRARWIREVVRSNPGALVIAFQYFVNIQTLAACVGLPNSIVVSERNDPARVGGGFPRDLIRKLLYRKAAMLVCQTEEAASYFSDRINKVVILNPVKPGLPTPYHGVRRKTIVTFCRLEQQKNLEMLIHAFATFRITHADYSLEIYGEGSERAALLALINSLNLTRVAYVLDARSDIHDVVRDCAIFVLPSNYEGLSNSMIEAMAMGLPTICTDCPCGGARMVITDGENGLLVPVGDVHALATAMSRIADNPEFARGIGSAGLKLRERLSVSEIASEWTRLLPRELKPTC